MALLATILGCSGLKLTPGEIAFFRDAQPWAFILFGRNIDTPNQLRALCQNLREAVGRDAPIFIDQEGGRVQRLRPPHWDHYRPARDYADIFTLDPEAGQRATYLHMRLIADDLRQVGITANCAPVLDIPVAGADDIISDRAYGDTPQSVIPLAHAAMAGLMTGGVAPVIKHIPGHGRATVDSHKALPVIKASALTLGHTDFVPFEAFHDAPMAMTAHAIYEAIDSERPITISKQGISQLIRKKFGFDGLLMSDDLDMKALSGSLTSRTEACLTAGCDIALQCSGQLPDMVQIAKGAKHLAGDALRRAELAEQTISKPLKLDRDAAQKELEAIFAARDEIMT